MSFTEMMIENHFKPTTCTICGEQAQPVMGEFVGFGEIYRVHFYCPHCNSGFEREWGG